MNQTAKMRELDALVSAKLAAVGLADACLYDDGTPCTVLIDRTLQEVGADPASLNTPRVLAHFQRAEISEPRRDAVLRIVATGEEFRLREETQRDETRTTWWVVPAAPRATEVR